MGVRLALVVGLVLPFAAAAENPVVTFDTVLGAFDVELCEEFPIPVDSNCLGAAPNTVANFLANMAAGEYDDSVIHDVTLATTQERIIGGFFQAPSTTLSANAALTDSIGNEFNQDNTRGTLAMDKPSGQFVSHATRWFVNLDDNPYFDTALSGYAVFGIVLDMTVVDAIAALQRCDVRTQQGLISPSNLANLWGQMPHVGDLDPCNTPGGAAEQVSDPVEIPEELVMVNSITLAPEPAGAAAAALAVLLVLAARRRSEGARNPD
jgi:cyclophilin family peptidyl-prolyl cis-trans isomerase